MAVRKEDAAPELKDFQIGVSWISTTPAKPNSTKQQLICSEGQENHLVQANWVESERYAPANQPTGANLYEPGRLTGDSLLETQCQPSAACYSSTPLVNLSRRNSHNSQRGEGSNSHLYSDILSDFDTWQASKHVNSHCYGDNLRTYDNFSVRDTDKWTNMSFQNLLALADAGNKVAGVHNGLADMSFVATRSASTPYSHPQTEGGQLGNLLTHADFVATSKAPATLSFHPQYDGCQWMMSFGNSSMQDQDSLGVKYDTELNVPNVLMDGSSIPSRPSFNLNSPPRMITDAALSQSTSLQFAPITPEKTGKPDYMQESVTKDLSIDGKNAQEDGITTNGGMDLRDNKEKSHLITEQLCAATSTQLQENYKPDKGGTEEADLIKTPPPKTRRKKHRPKVIIEGRNKGTPRKPSSQQEPARPKRKYVRRKGVNNTLEGGISGSDSNKKSPTSTDNPGGKRKSERKRGIEKPDGDMNKGADGTTEIQAPRFTRSSCRRSLNFNSDRQVRDETSSYFPSSDCNRDSQAGNFNANDESRNVQCSGEQVMEKNGMDTFHVLTRSMNPLEEDYLSRPDQHSPSSSPSVQMDQPKSKHMPVDQTVCTRGKCQILFSDVTHDKEVNAVQVIMNPDGTRTTNSPNDSICSSTCLTPERQERGMKRVNTGANVEAELSNRNETRTFYNSLQAYLPLFSQNASKTDDTPLYHFPAIYKKKRTEKGHVVSSCSQHIAPISDNHVRLERHGLRDSCTKVFTSTANQGTAGAQFQVASVLTTNRSTDGTHNGRQVFEDLLALGPTEKTKRRRSKGVTRLRDLSSLLKICQELPSSSGREATTSRVAHEIEILNEPYTCMEALVADTHSKMKRKKRSKRSMLINSAAQNSYSNQKLVPISMGPPLALMWKCMSPVDSLTEQLNQLDLNAESSQTSVQKQNRFTAYHTNYQEQHALVPFQRYGAVIPYDSSFDQVRRRRPRPKVDLDDETTRVWKLLLENINSEGIDGTDDEKMKWWEEERRVFNGRADSFIARMHLVQGDRRFSPWKGSVVDSVVGVFLTQNVSDHLSSSAFMSMAARFPLESKTHPSEFHDEELGTKMKEPEICELDPHGNFELNEDILDQSVHGEVMTMLQDSKDDNNREVNSVKSSRNSCDGFVPKEDLRSQSTDTSEHHPVMSRETVTNKTIISIEDGKDTEDSLSSQTPEISSQNSADSPVAQTTERSDSCLMSTSEEPTAGATANRFTSSTSFVKLLQMAGTVLHGVYEKGSEEKTDDEYRKVHSESSALNFQNSGLSETPKIPAKSNGSYSKSALSNLPSFVAPATEFDLSKKDSKFFNSSSTKELCVAEISYLTSESASGTTFQNITDFSFKEGPPTFCSPTAHSSNNDKIAINQMVDGNATGQVPEQNFLEDDIYRMQEVSEIPIHAQNMMDVTGSTSNIGHSRCTQTKEVSSNKHDPGHIAKAGRPKKEKEKQVEWDLLRKHAQTGGKDRARTANTMDSVDWDAVRCADVNEIAQTIKERGMNNMLAERIKDFLNRLVRDHGSIDLEWLRDVPPDKAKEYLLSIRGLGLKSVECVRLLTLHHLAFPVDTNVGRIAVRLGWVPLQPLPESLQLHLLELYPVLESIQKYLWPRLCKLDQRTLYELHYQLITFGKVFCTKSKPNCNACPMRGECRHFASAFASARLALPAPEEKRVVNAIGNRTADHNPISGMHTLQLPPTHANQIGAISGVSYSEPIIEEPPSPEPIIEVPATPEPDYTQVPECDIESAFTEDPDEIPTIQLNMEEFTNNLQKIMQQNTELQEGDMSKALVALASEAASIPVPKLKNVSRLRTEHQVYELPDAHPLLKGMDKREPDDPSPYLLAIWTPGETMDSIEPPERQCKSQEFEKLCTDETCSSCNSIREANAQTVRGTLLIPCRTAMRGSFPLNGTYFQVNEVFSDHESSLSPMDVPREWLWNLPRRTVYFGTSIPTIFKGLSTEGIQYCFWRGFVCVRGFDRKTRAPRPLIARLHFPASRLAKGKGKIDEKDM